MITTLLLSLLLMAGSFGVTDVLDFYEDVAKIDDDTYQVQVVSWYDNENSYTSQMVRTIKYFAELK